MGTDIFTATKNWMDAPFTEPMDIAQLFLLTGLIMVFVVLWTRILAHLAHV